MSRARKYSVVAVLVLVALAGVQAGVSLLVRTHRVRGYLIAHLESAFGRPVQVGSFSFTIFPFPELDLEGVTIAEDPAFGHEYFLRAERMTASLAWTGLLRGHFEFGTMSLTRPSLILVRNADGRWNLEGWLPPARSKTASTAPSTTPAAAPSQATHLLQKLDFDDGRLNFKVGDEKRPFAFTGVSGNVEQVGPGRWRLNLEATPWRSGVPLQSTGTLQIEGDIAGTTARLQPAQIRLHWGRASVADLFRLITGNDSGMRGEFALDGNASIGVASPDTDGRTGEWHFVLMARGERIHRWDLTERGDSPRFNLDVQGYWNVVAGQARVDELRLELPHSNLNGSAQIQTINPAAWHAQFRDMAVQAEDLLAWYRAFSPGIADDLAIHQFLTGNLSAGGWPLRWQEGALEGRAGTLVAPGLGTSRIEPFRASTRDGKFALDNFRLRVSSEAATAAEKADKTPVRTKATAPASENVLDASLNHDSLLHQGGLRVNLHFADSTRFFTLASAFGPALNRGWEYTGSASGTLAWNWGNNLREPRRNGSVELSKAQLQVAGLNQPLKIEQAHLEWKDGQRAATIGKVDAFGANWSGNLSQITDGIASEGRQWQFQLRADHLDATQLDRWFGPRARPNWLQRLLPSLLGGNDNNGVAHASELLRQVSAEGELSADTLSIEKIKLAQVRATLSLKELHLQVRNIEAQWAGGIVRGGLQAGFSSLPHYELDADVDHVNLAQLPWPTRWAERWSGAAAGRIHVTTSGVGREELLRQMAGNGVLKLNKIEFHGWDVEASAEAGILRTGQSRWTSGDGQFEIGERMVQFSELQLQGMHGKTNLNGNIGFDMTGDLTFSPVVAAGRGSKNSPSTREFRVSGPLDAPAVVVQSLRAAASKTR